MSELIHSTTILQIQNLTHNVKRIVCTKPLRFEYIEGQAVEMSILKKGWEDQTRPFTLTSIGSDAVIEFIIKIYDSHNGVTEQINLLGVGDKLKLSNPFGTIKYNGEGIFIAGGAGITPFISILRTCYFNKVKESNKVIFSNKLVADVILENELNVITHGNLTNVFTESPPTGQEAQRIDKDFLSSEISNFGQNFYVCGPPKFNDEITEALDDLGASSSKVSFDK